MGEDDKEMSDEDLLCSRASRVAFAIGAQVSTREATLKITVVRPSTNYYVFP